MKGEALVQAKFSPRYMQSHRHGGASGGLTPQTKLQVPQIEL